jgi:hypothetical protein
MSKYPTIAPPPGYTSIAEAMSQPRTSPYLYSEYTKYHAISFIDRNLSKEMVNILTAALTDEMHQMIGQLAIKHHTIGWAFDPTQNGIKRLTIDDCKNDLKKMYIMYYNVYKKKLMPKGQVRDEFDYMKNFKNRLKVIRANMFQTTCLDGNTLDHTRQDTVIIP